MIHFTNKRINECKRVILECLVSRTRRSVCLGCVYLFVRFVYSGHYSVCVLEVNESLFSVALKLRSRVLSCFSGSVLLDSLIDTPASGSDDLRTGLRRVNGSV